MTNTTELRKIAEYLGCNEDEFISEVSKLIEAAEKAKVEEVLKYIDERHEIDPVF